MQIKFIIVLILSFLVGHFIAFGQDKKVEKKELTFIVDSIYSGEINDYRHFKIFIPETADKDVSLPVLYTLDGDWMFEPTVYLSKIKIDFEVIPNCIVVGVYHKNRSDDLAMDWNTGELDKGGVLFYEFLHSVLIPYIDKNYPTSGFNVLIGHSNSATFCHKILTTKDQPFKGFIAISQNLFGNQLAEFTSFTETHNRQPIFYFVASGDRDATPRIASGLSLDSLFSINTNQDLFLHHAMFNADHNGLVGQSLGPGISYIFSEFKHFNDWDEKLRDSLKSANISSFDFYSEHARKLKQLYGINFKANQNDLSVMQAMTKTKEDIELVKAYELEHLGMSDHFYATYAQFYEYAELFPEALEYWTTNLSHDYEHNDHFFYYKRPLQLLQLKMKQPDRAIEFALQWKSKKPSLSQEFNYWIAKIALESGTDKETGFMSIQEYIANYQEDSPIPLQKAREMEQSLKTE